MLSDIEIARSVRPLKITEVAKKIGITEDQLELYGNYKAKIIASHGKKKGKLILVTAINPTKSGNGKTTVSIGLADAFQKNGDSVCLALREPSLGPVFGTKGGATGGGFSQIIPMEDINLHFTGDFHAITSANNLLCSLIDNHIFQGNALKINPQKILFRRCLDINERALREVECETTYPRHERFIITAASEIMAIVCMVENIADLKVRLGNIMVALDTDGKPIYAKDLKKREEELQPEIDDYYLNTIGKLSDSEVKSQFMKALTPSDTNIGNSQLLAFFHDGKNVEDEVKNFSIDDMRMNLAK